MLTQMRHFVRSPIAVILVALLVLSFIVWGTGDIFRASRGDSVAIVGPEKISVTEAAKAWRQEVDYRSRTSQGKFSEEEARKQGLPDLLLDQLITQTAFKAKANQMGIKVSPQMLLDFAKGYKAFLDPITGKFSDEQYQTILQQARMTPKEFENGARNDIKRQQFLAVIDSGVRAPASWSKNWVAYQGQSRKVESLYLPYSVVPQPPASTDKELQDYMADNERSFMIPERRSATLVLISAEELAQDIKPSDEELKKEYDFDHSQYVTPETRTWIQIPAQDETQAKLAAARLQQGEDPKQIMLDLKIPGDPIHLDQQPKIAAPDDQIGAAVFAAKIGESGATEGRLAWSAWRLSGITPAKDPSFADLKEQLATAYIQKHAKDKLFDIAGNFEGDRSDGLSLAEAAQKEHLSTISLPPVDARGADADLNLVEVYKAHPEILKTLFDLDELVESDVEELPNGDYFALVVDKVIPASTPKFEDVKDEVETSWVATQQAKALEAFSKTAHQKLLDGMSLSDMAKLYDGARVEYSIVNRVQAEPSLPASVQRGIFNVAVGKVVAGVLPTKKELVFSKLDDIIPANTLPDQAMLVLQSQIDQDVKRDLENEFASGLRASYTVKVDQRLKDLAFGANGN